jgi:RNA polymerase sigma-70 factor (ECF subfamily)
MNTELSFGDGGLCADDGDVISAIFKDHSDMVYRLAVSQAKNKADAEDIFQEVFVRLIKSGKTFESDEHVKAWLIRVTVNCCKKQKNTAWLRRTVPLEEWSESLAAEERDDLSDVCHAVAKLPQKYRTIIHLFYYEDMPVAEIGRVLGMKQSNALSRLRRARNILREKLKGEYSYE